VVPNRLDAFIAPVTGGAVDVPFDLIPDSVQSRARCAHLGFEKNPRLRVHARAEREVSVQSVSRDLLTVPIRFACSIKRDPIQDD
jgi:hypothetical protein